VLRPALVVSLLLLLAQGSAAADRPPHAQPAHAHVALDHAAHDHAPPADRSAAARGFGATRARIVDSRPARALRAQRERADAWVARQGVVTRTAVAFAAGVKDGPIEVIQHLANKQTLATALTVTGGLGIATHLLGVSLVDVVEPVLVGVLGIRWVRAVRDLRQARTAPAIAHRLGQEVIAAGEIGLELLGVQHIVADSHAAEAGRGLLRSLSEVSMAGTLDALRAATPATLARDAIAGVIGLHEIFYIEWGKGHGHGGHAPGHDDHDDHHDHDR
jgi:hypothetical protein